MGNNKVSNRLRRTQDLPRCDGSGPKASRRRQSARNGGGVVGAGDAALELLPEVMRPKAPTAGTRLPKLKPASLLKVGVAMLLYTSGAQARGLLETGPALLQAPSAWAPGLPRPAAAPAVQPSAPPPPVPYNPFVAARATQSADLLGDTRNATAFNLDAQGRPVVRASDVHQDIDGEGDCQTLSVLASVAEQARA